MSSTCTQQSDAFGLRLNVVLCVRDSSAGLREARLRALHETLSKIPGGHLIFGLNASEQAWLRERLAGFRTEENFEGPEGDGCLDDVNESAIRMAATWYRDPLVAALLDYQGVNLGEIYQHPLTYAFVGVVRDAALLAALFTGEKIRTIFFANLEGVVEMNLRDFTPQTLLELWYSETPPARITRKPFFDSALRFFFAFLWKASAFLGRPRMALAKRRILVSSDLKHAGPVMRVLEKNPHHALYYMRPGPAVRLWKDFQKRGILFCVPPQRAEWRGLDRQEVALLEERSAELEVFRYQGIGLWKALRPALRRICFSEFPLTRRRVAFFKRWLETSRIDGILVDEDVCPFNKALILSANLLGIPSVVIQHGAAFWIVPIALAPVSATKIAAWGTYSRELLREWGVPDEKIEITGVPRYDEFFSSAGESEERARQEAVRELRLDPAKKIAVLATDPFHEAGRADFVGNYLTQNELAQLIKTTIAAAKHFPDLQLVLKLHPRDPFESFTRDLVRSLDPEKNITVTRLYPTQKLVRACDLLMTVCSTVAIEAILCQKPVITINLRGTRDLQPHAELGAALSARDETGLRDSMDKALHDPGVRRELSRKRLEVIPQYVHTPDKDSSRRVADLLETPRSSEGAG